MTSRKNQQAARQYMQTHDVSYMEALRRTTSSNGSRKTEVRSLFPASVTIRPEGRPLVLGYSLPMEPETSKVSVLDRFRGRHPEPIPSEPEPLALQDVSTNPLITGYGPVGGGKTVYVRSILEQFRGHAAYVVHMGDVIYGDSFVSQRGVKPWDELVEVNLQQWSLGTGDASKVPTPPSLDTIPRGTLILFDFGSIRERRGHPVRDFYSAQAYDHLSKWFAFEDTVARAAQERGFIAVTSVLTEASSTEWARPLEDFWSPFQGGVRVRVAEPQSSYQPRSWVYEVVGDEPWSGAHLVAVSKGEASHYRLRRPDPDERSLPAWERLRVRRHARSHDVMERTSRR